MWIGIGTFLHFYLSGICVSLLQCVYLLFIGKFNEGNYRANDIVVQIFLKFCTCVIRSSRRSTINKSILCFELKDFIICHSALKEFNYCSLYLGSLFTIGQIPILPLNFTAIATELPYSRELVESCVKEVIQAVSRSLYVKRNVEFVFAGIGCLSIRDLRVKMKFFKEFVKGIDKTGELVNALKNVRRVDLSNPLAIYCSSCWH